MFGFEKGGVGSTQNATELFENVINAIPISTFKLILYFNYLNSLHNHQMSSLIISMSMFVAISRMTGMMRSKVGIAIVILTSMFNIRGIVSNWWPDVMEYTMFADESGTNDGSPCFSIGCVLIPSELLESFEAEITALLVKHNLPNNELKWEGIRNSHGRVNFLIDVIKLLLAENPYVFVGMVVLKTPYRKWHSDQEEAFYTCHTQLMTYCARELNSTLVAKIDEKSDAYDKHNEVVQIIANYNLKVGDGQIKSVNKESSKELLLIQVADLITGAITTGHNLFQNSSMEIHQGKRIAIQKIAECLSWNALHYDTFPNTSFNIWHFPIEFRAQPKTENVKSFFDVQYVTPSDFK